MENKTESIGLDAAALSRALGRAIDKQEYSDYVGSILPEQRLLIDKLIFEKAKKNNALYHYSWFIDPDTGKIDYTLMGNNSCENGRAKAQIHSCERHSKVLVRLHKKLTEKGKTPNNTFKKV